MIGGAIAANNAYAYYDGGPAYYDAPAYYDDQYGDDGVVAVVPAPVGEDFGLLRAALSLLRSGVGDLSRLRRAAASLPVTARC